MSRASALTPPRIGKAPGASPGSLGAQAGEDDDRPVGGQRIRSRRDDRRMGMAIGLARQGEGSAAERDRQRLGKSSGQTIGRRPADQEDMSVLDHAVGHVGVGLDGDGDIGPAASELTLQGCGGLALRIGFGDRSVDDQRLVELTLERIDRPDPARGLASACVGAQFRQGVAIEPGILELGDRLAVSLVGRLEKECRRDRAGRHARGQNRP